MSLLVCWFVDFVSSILTKNRETFLSKDAFTPLILPDDDGGGVSDGKQQRSQRVQT